MLIVWLCVVQAGYAWAVADLSPLDFWEGDEYKPLTISGSCDRLRVVEVGIIN